MKIETKYNIGDYIWNIYEHRGEACVYDTYIDSMVKTKDDFVYCCDDGAYTELHEEDIILYEETDKLVAKIQELMKEINEREEK